MIETHETLSCLPSTVFCTQAKRTKKVGVVGKYGTRYGSSLRKQVKKIEVTQHGKYTCQFCGKDAVKRQAVGIWHCGSCRKTISGGAWVVRCVLTGWLALGVRVAGVGAVVFPMPPVLTKSQFAACPRSLGSVWERGLFCSWRPGFR